MPNIKPTSKSEDITFLLGAGASIPCGIPGMTQLSEEFKVLIRGHSRLNDIVGVIERSDDRNELGIELLLEKIHLLALLSQDGNSRMIQEIFKLREEEYDLFDLSEQLRRKIVSFLIERCLEFDEDKAQELYKNFFNLRHEFDSGKMNIFSLNYDLCVETICRTCEIDCSTGFGDGSSRWTGNFGKSINLYKLHGSVTWKGRDTEVVETLFPSRNPTLIGKKNYEPIVLYPMIAKHKPYVYPFTDLIRIFEDSLSYAKVCAIIGYSLSDSHIEQILQKAMRKNSTLEIWLLSPHADAKKQLKFSHFSESWPSRFQDRFYAINACFDDVPDVIRKRLQIRNELIQLENKLSSEQSDAKKGEIYAQVAWLWMLYRNYGLAIENAEQGLAVAAKNSNDQRKALSVLMFIYDILSQDEDEKETALALLESYRRLSMDEMSDQDLFTLGKAYYITEDKKMAEKYLKSALTSSRGKSPEMFRRCYREIIQCLGREILTELLRREGPDIALEAEDYEAYGKTRRESASLARGHGNGAKYLRIHKEDIRLYERMLKNKENATIWENLGEAYYAVGRKKKALACFKKAEAIYSNEKQFLNEKRVQVRTSFVEEEIRWDIH